MQLKVQLANLTVTFLWTGFPLLGLGPYILPELQCQILQLCGLQEGHDTVLASFANLGPACAADPSAGNPSHWTSESEVA